MPGLPVHRQLEIDHGLQHVPSKRDHQLVLGVDVQGEERRRIQGDEAEHGVPAPDEPGIRPAARVGKTTVGGDQGRELNLPHVVDLSRLQRGHHPLIRHLGGFDLDTGQLQVVGSQRGKDLDQLRALRARLQPAPGPLGQVDHVVPGQRLILVIHPQGEAAGPDRGDRLHGQRLFRIDRARLQGDVFVEGPLAPGRPGGDAGRQLQIGKRLIGIDLVPLQVGADPQVGNLPLPPLDSVLLDHPGVVLAPGFSHPAAGGEANHHRSRRREPKPFPVKRIPHVLFSPSNTVIPSGTPAPGGRWSRFCPGRPDPGPSRNSSPAGTGPPVPRPGARRAVSRPGPAPGG